MRPCIHYLNFDYEEFSDIKFKIVNNVPSVITLAVEIFQKRDDFLCENIFYIYLTI